jgi:hypothetical protein
VNPVYLRPQLNRHVRLRAQLLDQIVGHAFFQGIAAHQEGDPARMIGKVQRRLAGRVSGADEENVEPVRGAGLAARGAVVDALADEPVEAVDRP